MIPDAEKLVGAALRNTLSTRVVGKTPDDKSTAWIRLTMLDARGDLNVPPDYLISFMLQCDCYAGSTGGQPEAVGLGLTARAALHNMIGTTLAGTAGSAVVSHVSFPNMARIPDTEGFEPARERVVLDARVLMHEVS